MSLLSSAHMPAVTHMQQVYLLSSAHMQAATPCSRFRVLVISSAVPHTYTVHAATDMLQTPTRSMPPSLLFQVQGASRQLQQVVQQQQQQPLIRLPDPPPLVVPEAVVLQPAAAAAASLQHQAAAVVLQPAAAAPSLLQQAAASLVGAPPPPPPPQAQGMLPNPLDLLSSLFKPSSAHVTAPTAVSISPPTQVPAGFTLPACLPCSHLNTHFFTVKLPLLYFFMYDLY